MAQKDTGIVVAVQDATLHILGGARSVVLHAGDSIPASEVADYVLEEVKDGKAVALRYLSQDESDEAAKLADEASASYDDQASVEVVQPETQDVLASEFIGDQVQQVETSLGVTPEGDSVYGSAGIEIEKGLSGPVDEV